MIREFVAGSGTTRNCSSGLVSGGLAVGGVGAAPGGAERRGVAGQPEVEPVPARRQKRQEAETGYPAPAWPIRPATARRGETLRAPLERGVCPCEAVPVSAGALSCRLGDGPLPDLKCPPDPSPSRSQPDK